jgi:hypothetical protein
LGSLANNQIPFAAWSVVLFWGVVFLRTLYIFHFIVNKKLRFGGARAYADGNAGN